MDGLSGLGEISILVCDWSGLSDRAGLCPAMTWPHAFMKSTAENVSPRTWAQVRPTDIPPHLNRVIVKEAEMRWQRKN